MREGQALGDLLGYRFERGLHDRKLDRFIVRFRREVVLHDVYDAPRTRTAGRQARAAMFQIQQLTGRAAARLRIALIAVRTRKRCRRRRARAEIEALAAAGRGRMGSSGLRAGTAGSRSTGRRRGGHIRSSGGSRPSAPARRRRWTRSATRSPPRASIRWCAATRAAPRRASTRSRTASCSRPSSSSPPRRGRAPPSRTGCWSFFNTPAPPVPAGARPRAAAEPP